jgi:hypothetical protein
LDCGGESQHANIVCAVVTDAVRGFATNAAAADAKADAYTDSSDAAAGTSPSENPFVNFVKLKHVLPVKVSSRREQVADVVNSVKGVFLHANDDSFCHIAT